MNTRNMIHTRQARWFVDTHTAVGCDGRLRCAVLLLTPYENHFVEFPRYRHASERLQTAARLVRMMFDREVWYRRPRSVRTGSKELTAALKERLQSEVLIRTDARAARFNAARSSFEVYVANVSRKRAWLNARRLVV